MKILLVFALISLVLCQTNVGSTSCTKPCYSANTNPCPSTDLVCKESPTGANGSPTSNCPRVCVKRTATSDEISAAFTTCSTPCDISYYQCTVDEYCKQYNTCSNCEPKPCNQVTCTQAPCTADVKGRECAAKVSANAVCKDNYCSGCFAEWYVGTNRICTDVPDSCTPCSDACPANSKRKINIFTGCEDCAAECVTTCPSTSTCDSTVQCPYGHKLDSNGCPTCTCNPCPDFTTCNLQCPNNEYLVDPNTQCKKCACASTGCSNTFTCDLNCPNGYTVDANGCKECKCKETCPQLTCSTADCVNGRVYKDGCPTCDCLPYCQNQCPYGYDFASGTANSLECKCYCKPLVCERDCPNAAYVIDRYGCKTCECAVYDTCTKVACDLYCPYGYVKDPVTGCPKCECVEKPNVCPSILCNADCIYGRVKDEFGCPTCECTPCPEVLCTRYCEFGFKKGSTGCEVCECNPAPSCPTGTVDVANVCPLNCEKGYVTDSGCTYCKCNPVEPCECVGANTDQPILCPDGVTYQKTTDLCARTEDNKCYYVQTKCPIGIEVKINVKLTEDQINAIATKVGVTSTSDVSTKFVDNKDGTYTYTFWVTQEGIPEGKTANDVNRDVGDEAKKQDPNAISYVLSDGSVTQNFANVLVPFIGLISLVLFF